MRVKGQSLKRDQKLAANVLTSLAGAAAMILGRVGLGLSGRRGVGGFVCFGLCYQVVRGLTKCLPAGESTAPEYPGTGKN